MLKQSHSSSLRSMPSHRHNHHTHLYDKVRRDLFEEQQDTHKKIQIPSITTICLLQIQAYIIQILANLPPKIKKSTAPTSSSSIYYLVQQRKMHIMTCIKSVFRQCLRWVLLVILLLLDNIARLLNVEREMSGLTKESTKSTTTTSTLARRYEDEEDEDEFNHSSTDINTYHDDYYMDQQKKQYHHDPCANNNNNKAGGTSEPASPTQNTKRNNNGLVSPSSPMNSPTPNFVVRQKKTSANANHTAPPSSPSKAIPEESPVLGPSRVNRTGHVRSLSNNMIDQQKMISSPQKLRRITAQREITVQNAVLPILPKEQPPRRHHHHHHHKKSPITSSVANSVASRSSSESSSTTKETTVLGHDFLHRPRMQKTMSLSTAQQYQQQQQQQQNELNSAQIQDNLSLIQKQQRQDLMKDAVQPVQQQQQHHHLISPWRT